MRPLSIQLVGEKHDLRRTPRRAGSAGQELPQSQIALQGKLASAGIGDTTSSNGYGRGRLGGLGL